MATVDDYPSGAPGTDPFPATLEPYLGAVLVRCFDRFPSLCLTFILNDLAGKFLLWLATAIFARIC